MPHLLVHSALDMGLLWTSTGDSDLLPCNSSPSVDAWTTQKLRWATAGTVYFTAFSFLTEIRADLGHLRCWWTLVVLETSLSINHYGTQAVRKRSGLHEP